MESHRDVDLSAELRALRPVPRPEFVAELDSRASAGFPSIDRPTTSVAGHVAARLRALGRIPERLGSAPWRRLLATGGAVAVTAIVVTTALVVTSEDGRDPNHPSSTRPTSDAVPGGRSTRLSESSPSAEPRPPGASRTLDRASQGGATVAPSGEAAATGSEGYAPGVTRRNVERSAEIVLGTDASGVRSAATKVFDTVHGYNGIVLRSSIDDGSDGKAAATFHLLIPSHRLGDAMAAFSGIAEVRSRSDSSADVTAPTIDLRKRLRNARARVEDRIAEVSGAGTEVEREAAEAKLRSARRQVATLRARLDSLRQRTHLSNVSLRIESTGAASHSGNWGVGDAFSDAGRILAVAAGVSLLALAILVAPISIGVLAWLTRRAWVRRARRQALD